MLCICVCFSVSAFAYPPSNEMPYTPIQQWYIECTAAGLQAYAPLPTFTAGFEDYPFSISDLDGNIIATLLYAYDPVLNCITYNLFTDGTDFDDVEVRFFTLTPYAVPNFGAPLCYLSSDTAFAADSNVCFAYNYREDSEDRFSEEWLTSYENRSYNHVDSGDTLRLQLNPVYQTIVTSAELMVYFEELPSSFTFSVPCAVTDSMKDGTFMQGIMGYWDVDIPIFHYIEGTDTPNAVQWVADMAQSILDIRFLPGITVGGIVLAFVVVPIVIALLKLFAGG